MINSNNRKILLVLVIIALVAGIFSYVLNKKSDTEKNGATQLGETSATPTVSTVPTISTKYISPQDWPPQVQVLDQRFDCTEAGTETARAGQTTRRTVGDRTYCVTKVSEGAAGSIYTQYAYAFPKGDKTVIYTFSLRFVQCANYDEPKKKECEVERETFDLDAIVDEMAKGY